MSSKYQYIARNKKLKEKGLNFKQFLISKWWTDVKDFILSDPEYYERYKSCNFCKKERKHLHHTKYGQIFARTLKQRLRDVIPLCASCHLKIHELANLKYRKGLSWCTREVRSQEFKVHQRK